MAQNKEYTVTLATGEATVRLSDEEAKERGLTASAKASKPANKQASAENKAASTADKRAAAASQSFGGSKG